eukprot:7529519-Pyramimonas_sp.AAC.1
MRPDGSNLKSPHCRKRSSRPSARQRLPPVSLTLGHAFDMDILRLQRTLPARVVRPPVDLSLLQGFPEYVPPGPWAPEQILEFMPRGAPGLDGHRAEWLDHLYHHSLERIAALLTRADRGRLP